MEIEELMKQMICLFDNVGKAVLEEQEKLSQKDMELSDLDHYLEINKLKSYELAKLGKLRQRLRKEKREKTQKELNNKNLNWQDYAKYFGSR